MSERPILALGLSDDEQAAALECMKVLNMTLRGLMSANAPALALLVATCDTVSDAGGFLIPLAEQHGPQSTSTAYRAIHESLTILLEYFDAQERSVLFESGAPDVGETRH